MLKKFHKDSRESFHVRYDRARVSIHIGIMVGLALSGLTFMLFTNWLPERFFVPIVTGSGVLFGILFYIYWPIVTVEEYPEDHPDNISPAERVRSNDTTK